MTAPPSARAAVSISLTVPSRTSASAARFAKYVSPATQSVSIDAGTGPQNFNLAAGAPGCTSQNTVTIAVYPITAGAQSRSIVAGPDGAMWFNEDSGAAISKIQLDGTGYTRYPNFGSRLNNVIAVGPDGNFWMAYLFGALNLGVYNTAGGHVADYALPVQATFITAGPDGAMWYTEFSNTHVQRMAVGGTPVTQYALSSAGDHIAVGPDGNLWTPESGSAAKIARVTTAGVVTEFPAGTAASDFRGIAAGPDGAMWVTEFGSNRIGRITTSGTFTDVALPAGVGAYEIVAGPDGAMWFTDYSNNNIGRITMSGIVNTYSVPTAASTPTGISVGPDGAIWFTEQNKDKIGRVSLPGGVSCNISVSVPIGNDTFTIKAYNAPGGSAGAGTVLSMSTVNAAVTAAGPNVLTFSLGGVVNRVRVNAAQSVIHKGSVQSIPIFVQALDASGSTILGGSLLDAGGNSLTILLSDADGSGSTALSTSLVTSGGASVMLNYNGSLGASAATITPTVSGGSIAGGVTPLVLTFQ